jgi:Mrp family chromosome partitioning ATPase
MMKSDKAVARACDEIRDRVLASGHQVGGDGGLVIVLMSRTPREGVTTVTAELGKSLGRSGHRKVLILDRAGQEPSVASRLRMTPMVFEKRQGGYSLQDIKQHVEYHKSYGVHLLLLGEHHPVDDTSWDSCFPKLRAEYDVILVDGGALRNDSPLQWCHRAHQVLLVLDTTRTTMGALERMKADLKYSKYHMTGVILNKRRHYVPEFIYRSFLE